MASLVVVLSCAVPMTPADDATITAGPPIEEIVNAITESMVQGYIAAIQAYGPHPTGSDACTEVQGYLVGMLDGWGLEVQLHPWNRRSYAGNNIIATLPGTDPHLTPIAVSAHYDSAPDSPGADDNGSGVAAVLSIAQSLRSHSFNRTIMFILFSGEEQGTLGSLSYAADRYHAEESMGGVINLDGIGHTETPSGGKKVIVYEEPTSAWLADAMDQIAGRYPQELEMDAKRLPNTGYSDHNSFLSYGYGAIQVEEYEYNDKFHTANDTLDYVNITYATNIARLTAGTVAHVASTPIPGPEVSIIAPRRDLLYVFNREIVPLSGGTVVTVGPVDIVARASAETVRVTFYLDGQVMRVDEEAPFTWTCRQPVWWDHTVLAEAEDGHGDRGIAHIRLGWSLY
jgi:hypothetical protein